MKKISLMVAGLLLSGAATLCQAQGKFTIWYGANISNVSLDGGSPDSEFKALNLGVDYTAPIDETFDWTAGAAFVTKGCKEWDPAFLQIDANASWNFLKNEDFKLGVLTGPYADIMVAKDDAEDTNAISMGWQAGVKGTWKDFSLKVGYEFGMTDVFKDGKSKANGAYFRLGYSF